MKNTLVRLAKRPEAEIEEDTFEIEQTAARLPDDGEIQVAIEYISIDPTMRTWVADIESYVPPVAVGDVMRAGAVGDVTGSRHPEFKVGDKVHGMFGVQSIYTGPAERVTMLDTHVAPAQDYLGGLGGTGLAAYFGILKVGALAQGETVVVSAAAGAVGHLVVQIGKLKGARVVGIAGGTEKCRRVVEVFGADACIDYKSEDLSEKLKQFCPDGVDVYFDNVGGKTLETLIDHLAMRARIVISGAISKYNELDSVRGPRNYLNLIGKGARMEGLLNMHWVAEFDEARQELATWAHEGRIKFHNQIEHGLENFPTTLGMLFSGQNVGKLLLKV